MSYESLLKQQARTKRLTGYGIVACLLIAALLALQSCVSANAAPSDRAPTLAFSWYTADSARVTASWSKSCDAKGCADAYQVRWAAIGAARAITRAQTADTFFVARPAFGDSLMVSVSVTPVRRGVLGAVRTTSAWLRTPDAPPPAVDSLKVDTLALAESASRDSFPVIEPRWVRSNGKLYADSANASDRVCILSRNRYTGEVAVFAPFGTTHEQAAAIERECEPARVAFQSERSG